MQNPEVTERLRDGGQQLGEQAQRLATWASGMQDELRSRADRFRTSGSDGGRGRTGETDSD